jgi:diguanylate cyclase (GGDEF)-like protein
VSKRPDTPDGLQGNGDKRDPREKRLGELADDQVSAAEDQTASDAEQTGADADQTASDLDRDLSERDQIASDRDQAASDHDQEISDEELSSSSSSFRKAHDVSRAGRLAGTEERKDAARIRALTADDRADRAAERDEIALHRDRIAQRRDERADRRDRESEKLERKMASRGSRLTEALSHAAGIRTRAAVDRARAAKDRKRAAIDRERAAREREATLAELRLAHVDELTGAFRRGAGDEALTAEIARARRGDGRMVLAFIDVNSLREINNSDGHAAGDAVLRDVVAGIRSNIRTYEPIVRYGGDEFVCAMSGVDLRQAQERFDQIRESLERGSTGAEISVGLAELREDDELGDLVERADAALLEARNGPRLPD